MAGWPWCLAYVGVWRLAYVCQRMYVRQTASHWLTSGFKTKKAVMISSPSESLNILVSRNIWFITKF